MVSPTYRSGSFPQINSSAWQAFLLESLCGILTIAWYILVLSERLTFNVLTGLTSLTDALSDDPNRGRDEFRVTFDEAESPFARQHDGTQLPRNRFESASLHRSQDRHCLPVSKYDTRWTPALAGMASRVLRFRRRETPCACTDDFSPTLIPAATLAVTDTRKRELSAEQYPCL